MSSSHRPMTLTSKILCHHGIGLRQRSVGAGDLLRVRVDWTIASELAFNGMNRTYEQLGRPPLHDPDRFYLALDHTVDPRTLAEDSRTKRLVQLSRDFARDNQLRHFYDANETIMHTTFYRNLVLPGELVLGADSHTSSHGGMGAFAIGLGGADVTVAMVLGETWLEVPEAIAVEYRGELPFGLSGKDVILKTLGDLGRNTVAFERSVEYVGNVGSFTADMRFAICNMTAELGGLNGIFVPDGIIAEAIERRRDERYRGGTFFRADDDAPYAERFVIDLDRLPPQIAKPFSPDNVHPVDAVAGQPLDGVFIGACTTTEEELVLAGLVLEQALAAGDPPKPSDKRLVVPGNRAIAENLRSAGLLAVYQRAGFRIGPPGCSMCLGIASDRAGEGEVWLSSQNRNFRNRMGRGSMAWLGSAASVAASALSLRVTDPRALLGRVDQQRYAEILDRPPGRPLPEVSFEEPDVSLAPHEQATSATGAEPAAAATLRGRVQRFADHVDTDAIIPGEFCHLVDLRELGRAAFRYVRPEFFERAAAGHTIVVAGHGWGTGSSREQAVWALQGAGIQAVIARSFAFIHKRNLVNEALPFIVVDDERFYEQATEGVELTVDPATSRITVVETGESFAGQPREAVAQALADQGGIVAAIRKHGARTFSRLGA